MHKAASEHHRRTDQYIYNVPWEGNCICVQVWFQKSFSAVSDCQHHLVQTDSNTFV